MGGRQWRLPLYFLFFFRIGVKTTGAGVHWGTRSDAPDFKNLKYSLHIYARRSLKLQILSENAEPEQDQPIFCWTIRSAPGMRTYSAFRVPIDAFSRQQHLKSSCTLLQGNSVKIQTTIRIG
jgi:hypothetical protein